MSRRLTRRPAAASTRIGWFPSALRWWGEARLASSTSGCCPVSGRQVRATSTMEQRNPSSPYGQARVAARVRRERQHLPVRLALAVHQVPHLRKRCASLEGASGGTRLQPPCVRRERRSDRAPQRRMPDKPPLSGVGNFGPLSVSLVRHVASPRSRESGAVSAGRATARRSAGPLQRLGHSSCQRDGLPFTSGSVDGGLDTRRARRSWRDPTGASPVRVRRSRRGQLRGGRRRRLSKIFFVRKAAHHRHRFQQELLDVRARH